MVLFRRWISDVCLYHGCVIGVCYLFFFFKQKTAYEMRISDWSSDVCSSDLFYPVQYEGEELSPNVFYTGAAPNQQAIPAVEYLMSDDGGGAERFFLLGTDYVYPRTTNKILRAFLISKGVPESSIEEVYTPFGARKSVW